MPESTEPTEPTLEETLAFAVIAHKGQHDKQGRPYIFHLMDIILALADAPESVQIVAALHDVLEKTATTYGDLAKQGYSPTLMTAVQAITRHQDEDDYLVYIDRVSKNPIARRAKLADVSRNLERLNRLPHALQVELHDRYLDAQDLLIAYENGNEQLRRLSRSSSTSVFGDGDGNDFLCKQPTP